MKRILYIAIVALTFMSVSCATQDDIQNLQGQIDKLRSDRIASVDSQISAINGSLVKLESLSAELKGYVSSLESQTVEIESADENLSKLISALKMEFGDNLSEEKIAVLTALESYRGVIAQQLSSISLATESLKSRQEAVYSQMSSLENYVEQELKKAADWASASFMTLEKYNEVLDVVSGIQATIAAFEQSSGAFAEQCATDKADLLSMLSDIETSFCIEIKSIITHCESVISDTKKLISNACAEALAGGIDDLESSLQSWVNIQLTGYSTLSSTESKVSALREQLQVSLNAQIDLIAALTAYTSCGNFDLAAQNAATIGEIQSALEANDSEAERLLADIASAKEGLRKDYEALIASAINEKEGKLDDALQAALSKIHSELETEVTSMNSDIQKMEARVKACESDIATLTAEIQKLYDALEPLLGELQSFVVVPSYTDGSVSILNGLTDIYFEVYPRKVAVELSKISVDKFLLYVTSLDESISSDVTHPVVSVADDGTFFIIKVDGTKLSRSVGKLKARLVVADEKYSWSTGYFNLTLE